LALSTSPTTANTFAHYV